MSEQDRGGDAPKGEGYRQRKKTRRARRALRVPVDEVPRRSTSDAPIERPAPPPPSVPPPSSSISDLGPTEDEAAAAATQIPSEPPVPQFDDDADTATYEEEDFDDEVAAADADGDDGDADAEEGDTREEERDVASARPPPKSSPPVRPPSTRPALWSSPAGQSPSRPPAAASLPKTGLWSSPPPSSVVPRAGRASERPASVRLPDASAAAVDLPSEASLASPRLPIEVRGEEVPPTQLEEELAAVAEALDSARVTDPDVAGARPEKKAEDEREAQPEVDAARAATSDAPAARKSEPAVPLIAVVRSAPAVIVRGTVRISDAPPRASSGAAPPAAEPKAEPMTPPATRGPKPSEPELVIETADLADMDIDVDDDVVVGGGAAGAPWGSDTTEITIEESDEEDLDLDELEAAEADADAKAAAEAQARADRQSDAPVELEELGGLAEEDEGDEELDLADVEAAEAKPAPPKPPPKPAAPPVPKAGEAAPDAAAASAATDVPAEKAARPKKKRGKPWFEEFFNEDYLRTVPAPSRKQVERQVDFIEQSLGLERGASILDVGCGLGLQAVELARRGYQVVGLDLSLAMLSRAADEASDSGASVTFLHTDMRELSFEGAFDAVLCWGTTFGYFDDDVNRGVLTRLHRALKPMGLLVLDVVNRDYVLPSQPNLVWFEGDGCVVMEETHFNFITSRLHVKRTVILDDGRQRENSYSVRLYSLHEIGQVLHQIQFRVVQVTGREATPGVFFGSDSPRMIILGERRLQQSATDPGGKPLVPEGDNQRPAPETDDASGVGEHPPVAAAAAGEPGDGAPPSEG